MAAVYRETCISPNRVLKLGEQSMPISEPTAIQMPGWIHVGDGFSETYSGQEGNRPNFKEKCCSS